MRHIGIRHRVKRSAKNEALPTQVAILGDGDIRTLDLADEQAELDFLRGRYPVKFRALTKEETLDGFLPHHIRWKEKKPDTIWPEHLTKKEGRKILMATHVPSVYEGLRDGDVVGMVLGGSGDYLALGLATRAKSLSNTVVRRITPSQLSYYRARQYFDGRDPDVGTEFDQLIHMDPTVRAATGKNERFTFLNEFFEAARKEPGADKKDRDAELLARLVATKPHRFYDVLGNDEDMILVRECQRSRQDAMKARMACEQRLRQNSIGELFRTEGLWQDGVVENAFNRVKASNAAFNNLVRAEAETDRALLKALKAVPFYKHLIEHPDVVGIGPAIAARIFSAVIDIRRFPKESGFVAFAGVHVLADGRQPRQRAGELANWHGDFRQALYLLGDQFVKRADSFWGKRLRENKAKLRKKHPEVVLGDKGQKRYTDGHIHKMALWRTLTQFTRWLYGEWKQFGEWKVKQEPLAKAA